MINKITTSWQHHKDFHTHGDDTGNTKRGLLKRLLALRNASVLTRLRAESAGIGARVHKDYEHKDKTNRKTQTVVVSCYMPQQHDEPDLKPGKTLGQIWCHTALRIRFLQAKQHTAWETKTWYTIRCPFYSRTRDCILHFLVGPWVGPLLSCPPVRD